MAANYTYESGGINFNLKDGNIPKVLTGGLLSTKEYFVDETSNEVFPPDTRVINAIDIAWTNAYLSNFNTYVNTSGEVLALLNDTGASISAIEGDIEEMKERLQALEQNTPTGGSGGGQDNLIERIKINSTELPIENKTIQIKVKVNGEVVTLDSQNYLDINTNVDNLRLSQIVESIINEHPEQFRGESAYDIAKRLIESAGGTFNMTEGEWIDSLKGPAGPQGPVGSQGLSAYEVYLNNGGGGTVDEWLESLQGPTGPEGIQGESAYQIAKRVYEASHPDPFPYETEEEWIDSITPTGEGVSYSAGYGIDISSNVISSTNKWIILNE